MSKVKRKDNPENSGLGRTVTTGIEGIVAARLFLRGFGGRAVKWTLGYRNIFAVYGIPFRLKSFGT